MAHVIRDPDVPYSGRVDGGFGEGRMVRVQGRTDPSASRFNINLKTGSDDEDDIAIHLSVRLVEGYIARNSQETGSWGEEQGDGLSPIAPGQCFEIIILSAANDYKIAVNGQHFAEFPHRIAPNRIRNLSIDGDIVITVISLEGGDEHTRSSASMQESGANQAYGPNPSAPQGQYGPPPGAPQGQYGPPPGAPQGQYGPPAGAYGQPQGYGPGGGYPQGPYGGAPPMGAYGQQPGAYGPPGPPPGHQEEGGLENFLGTASSVIAGAISSGMADKLISSLTGGNQQHPQQPTNQQQPYYNQPPQQQPPPPQQQSHGFDLSSLGGAGSIGGLGSVGGLLSSFAEQVLTPKRDGHH